MADVFKLKTLIQATDNVGYSLIYVMKY